MNTTPSHANSNLNCISYTDDGFVKVSLNKADSKSVDEGIKTINSIINSVKTNKQTDILADHFSLKDGSYEEIKKTLQSNPGRFNAYAKIKEFNVNHAYLWGNYLIFWTNYNHENKQTLILDAFYCEDNKSCKLSIAFDKSSPNSDLISRFMSTVRMGKKDISCGKNSAAFFVTEQRSKANPLAVFLSLEEAGEATEKSNVIPLIRKHLPASNQNCLDMISNFDIDKPDSADMQKIYRSIIADCTANLTEGSGIPVVKIKNQAHEHLFQTPAAVITDLQHIKDGRILAEFTDQRLKNYVVLLRNPKDEWLIYLIPTGENGKRLMDWSYFGTGAAELLVSEHFSHFIFEKYKLTPNKK